MRNRTIRIKIVLAFVTVVIFGSVILLIQSLYNKKESETRQFVNQLSNYKTFVLNDSRAQQEFFNIDLIKDEYYLSKNSSHLAEHKHWQDKMNAVIVEIEAFDADQLLISKDHLEILKNQTERYNSAFLELVKSATLLGYKDYGITGEMRKHAHLLENNFSKAIPLVDILMLRRHEKDFIIRKEDKYYEQFVTLFSRMRKQLQSKPNPNHEEQIALHELNQYALSFDSVYQYQKLNGLNTHSGLKAGLTLVEQQLIETCNNLIETTEFRAKSNLTEINRYFWMSIFLCLIFIGILVDYLARLLSHPIKLLSAHTNEFVDSDFTSVIHIEKFEGRKDEIGKLYDNFKKLAEEITIHFKNYRESAERKHQEISLKNHEIESQRTMLVTHRNLLSARNKSVTDSIAYAKRLQKAIFPPDHILEEKLGNHALYFKPKDIVSGDFYWVEETEDSLFFAVADCTGHGVPGAFMSLIGNNFLNQAILDMGLSETGEILDYLNTSISDLLNHGNGQNEIKDGMDIGLCRWVKSENRLQFSGANRPLIIVRNNEPITHKPNRLPIGWQINGNTSRFSTLDIDIEQDDIICLFTDGYYDQFGGENDKKFKFKRFKDILSDLDHYNFEENLMTLQSELDNWKGNAEQVDDICVLILSAKHFLDKAPHYSLLKHKTKVNQEKERFINGNRFKVVS